MRTTFFLPMVAIAAIACNEAPTGNLTGGSSSGSGGGNNTGGSVGHGGDGGGGGSEPVHTILDDRTVDYNEALRTASLKLLRELPTLEQIKAVQNATDPRAAYEAALDAMLEDPRFGERMIKFWKDSMRVGGAAANGKPSRDTAATFAAKIVVEGRPMTELFTAASGNCPTYDGDAKTFNDADCDSGAPQNVGVLTDPGVMMQFYGNMAFRRARWIQEVFLCTKFPAEYSETPVQMGANDYVSPWDFESVGTSPIDFQDTSSVICANCHTTINHFAPLLGHFDDNGMWNDGFAVFTPTAPDPTPTALEHWLRAGETLSWRLGTPTPDLPALGAAIAEDPDVAECFVSRAWNFAFSKQDIVTDLESVPHSVIEDRITEFESNGRNLKEVLRSIMKSDDFVKF